MTALWDWATAAYARPGVEALCLELQDRGRQSVPFLLWAAWAGAEGGHPGSRGLGDAAALARGWENDVIAPLRAVRRHLRGQGRDALRAEVAAAELSAERALMQALEAVPLAPAGGEMLEGLLDQAGRSWTPAADPGALKRLATLLR